MDMPSFEAVPAQADYDRVADLYDRAFADIRVRRDEWRWLSRRIEHVHAQGARPRLLDIGCGNGALLIALQARLRSGVGIDISARTIDHATRRARRLAHIEFVHGGNGALPFPDRSFDVVTSFLSFRYLDWDAVLPEIRRVLRVGGRLLVVDMAAQPVQLRDAWVLARSTAAHLIRPIRDRTFHRDVAALTAHPAWHAMLARHPIRSEHEYRAFFRRHFPDGSIDVLNTTLRKRLIGFDSAPWYAR